MWTTSYLRRAVLLLVVVLGADGVWRTLSAVPAQAHAMRDVTAALILGPPTVPMSACPPANARPNGTLHNAEELIERVERFRRLTSGSPLSLLLQATAYCLDGEVTNALRAYADYARAHPRNQQLWYDIGQLAEKSWAWEEAVAFYRVALKESPTKGAWHAHLGKALYRTGRGSEVALREISAAVALAPEGQFYAMGGDILVEERRYGEAAEWFRQAAEVDPNTPWWRVAYATSTWHDGNRAGALHACEDLTAQFPKYGEGLFECAALMQEADRHETAVAMIGGALGLDGGRNPWYWIRAGEIYESGGSTVDALNAYQRALAIDASVSTAREAIARLRNPKLTTAHQR